MLWICLWVHPYHNTTSILLTKLLGFPGAQCYVMDNALDSFLMASISMINIFNVFDNHHMMWMRLWMCLWKRPYHASTSLNGAFYFYGFGAHSGLHLQLYVVAEAIEPIRINPTAISNIRKVFESLNRGTKNNREINLILQLILFLTNRPPPPPPPPKMVAETAFIVDGGCPTNTIRWIT